VAKQKEHRHTGARLWELLQETYSEWNKDNAPQLGAALAFYTIFSLAPILVIIMAVVGYFLGKGSVQIYILNELSQFVGHDNAVNLMNMVQASYEPGSGLRATLIAIALMLVGSTTIFVTLKEALNTIWGVTSDNNGFLQIVKDRLLSFSAVLLIGFIIFISMIASSILAALANFLESFYAIPLIFFRIADLFLFLVMLTFMFAILYKVLPDARIAWKDVWVGSAITALLFTLGKFLLGLYIARSGVSSVYGAAGSFVAMLLWVYYSAQVVFVGAEFTQVYARKFGSSIAPKRAKFEA
jgi:membrane protein